MEEFLFQEDNVFISVIVHDSQPEPTIRVGKEEISVAQWERLYGRINALLHK